MPQVKRIFSALGSLLILGLAIYYIEPPKSWAEASIFQILIFFVPLLFLFTFLTNLFINFLPQSFIMGLGMLVLLVLWTAGQLTPIAVLAIISISAILFKFTRRSRRLTTEAKIPKLLKFRRWKNE